MNLLHHREQHVPFEDQPDPVEADLRDQIGRLTAEKRDLLGLIEQQRVDNARLEADNHRHRRHIAHLERAARRRWWRR